MNFSLDISQQAQQVLRRELGRFNELIRFGIEVFDLDDVQFRFGIGRVFDDRVFVVGDVLDFGVFQRSAIAVHHERRLGVVVRDLGEERKS